MAKIQLDLTQKEFELLEFCYDLNTQDSYIINEYMPDVLNRNTKQIIKIINSIDKKIKKIKEVIK